MKKRVLFIHYRTNERDGVSLEIEKKADILKDLGHDVYFLSGYDSRTKNENHVHVIAELDIKKRLPSFLRETFFDEKIVDKTLAWLLYQSEEEKIYSQVIKVLQDVDPNLIFLHNLFSLAYHLPASTAVLKALDYHNVKTVAVHHDFWWERGFYKTPRYLFLENILENLPPDRNYILKHQVINSIAQKKLFEERKIMAEKIGDYFDFSKQLPKKDDFSKDFLKHFEISENDIVILHATRIVPRKAIENALYFAHFLQQKIKNTEEFTFRGKKITKDSQVVIILPNFCDFDTADYLKLLHILAEKLQVKMQVITDDISLERYRDNGFKKYSFWDCYQFADLITYTSYLEGYGNQLLEAFWSKRIPIVFEYPVYEVDIKKDGYKVISLGNIMHKDKQLNLVPQETIEKAVEAALALLKDEKKYKEIVEKNFEIAKEHRDVSRLKKDLKALIDYV